MNRKIKLLLAVMFFIMLTSSLLVNSSGVFLPVFKKVYQINNTQIGLFFLLGSLFYMIGTYITSILLEYFTRRKTLLLGGFITFIGVICIISTNNVYLFYMYSILISTGVSAMSLTINTIVPLIPVKNKAVLINMIHFLYGFGAAITHKFSGVLLNMGFDYRIIYSFFLMLTIMSIVFLYFIRFPKETTLKVEKKEKVKFLKEEKIILTILAMALGFYICAEAQTANWYLNYMKQEYAINVNVATNYTSIFFFIFSFGRLFGGFVAEKIGYIKSVVISSLLGSVLFMIGLLLKEKGFIIISISGLFFSIVFPTVVLSVNNYFKRNLNQATGIIISMGAAINMLMGLLMGIISDRMGTYSAMLLIPIFLLFSAILLIYIEKNARRILNKVPLK